MARTLSIASQSYAVGTHGPWSVDSMTKENTDALEYTMTVGGDWSTDPTVMVCRVTLTWDVGGSPRWTFFGDMRKQDGSPLTLIREFYYVPRESDGVIGLKKKAIGAGDMTLEVFVPITTAITLKGV